MNPTPIEDWLASLELNWMDSESSPWGVRVLDIRPVTQGMILCTQDPVVAQNSVSFLQEDGLVFVGEEPDSDLESGVSLRFRTDGRLAPGVLFTPRKTEEQWAIFYHGGEIIFVRSALRQVQAIASTVATEHEIEIRSVRGDFGLDVQDDDFCPRVLDFVLRSHAIGIDFPAPIPEKYADDRYGAALWCFGVFGDRARFATPDRFRPPEERAALRTNSLLHIACARGDRSAIETELGSGVSITCRSRRGSPPIHWALASKDAEVTEFILDMGSPVDVPDADGVTPLMVAAELGIAAKASVLLNRGGDPNARDDRGFTALHRAAERGHREIVRMLLDHGALSNDEAEGHSPRSLAAARGEASIVALLDGAD